MLLGWHVAFLSSPDCQGRAGLQNAHRPGVLGILDEIPGVEQLVLHRLQGAQPQGPDLLLHPSAQSLQHLQHSAGVSGGIPASSPSQVGPGCPISGLPWTMLLVPPLMGQG